MKRGAILLILLIGGILLFYHLDLYDVWGDEALTYPKGETIGDVFTYVKHAGGTVHPPLYSLVQFAWMKLFAGYDVAKSRLLWAFFGLLNIFLVYLLGKQLFSRKIGLVAAFLAAFNPFLVQYSRMVRYYPLTATMFLLVLLFFFRLKETDKLKDWLWFTLAGALSLYQDYMSAFVLLFLYGYLALKFTEVRHQLKKWILAAVVMIVLFLPWAPTIIYQAKGETNPYPEHVESFVKETPRMAQRGPGLKSVIVNGISKLGFTAYIFSVGETTYPWKYAVSVPLFLTYLILFIAGAVRAYRGNDPNLRILFALTVFLMISTAFISEAFGMFGARLFQYPSKVLYQAFPVILICAAGLTSLKPKLLQAVLLILVPAGSAYGLANYYTGRQFLNPKFLAPWGEILADIERSAGEDDLILTDEEAFYHQVRSAGFPVEIFGLVGAIEKIEKERASRDLDKVFLVVRFRGDQTIYMEGMLVEKQLEQRYPLADVWNYLPADPEANPYWERILGKAPPDYLIQVFVFDIPGNKGEGSEAKKTSSLRKPLSSNADFVSRLRATADTRSYVSCRRASPLSSSGRILARSNRRLNPLEGNI